MPSKTAELFGSFVVELCGLCQRGWFENYCVISAIRAGGLCAQPYIDMRDVLDPFEKFSCRISHRNLFSTLGTKPEVYIQIVHLKR